MYHPECGCQKKLQIGKAFLKAQSLFKKLEASAKNSHYKNEYAPLGELYNASKDALEQHEIFIKHDALFHPVTHTQVSRTCLVHAPSGEFFEDLRYLVPEKPGSQGHGSADTYMKRYALRSLLAIDVGEDDDDGESERAYMQRVKQLVDVIAKTPEPRALYEQILAKFDVKDLKYLSEARLFDALLYVYTFTIKK